MFIWKKMGRVFDPTNIKGKKWLKEFAQAPETLIFDDFIRIFFACRPNRDKKTGHYTSYTSFVDVKKNGVKRSETRFYTREKRYMNYYEYIRA